MKKALAVFLLCLFSGCQKKQMDQKPALTQRQLKILNEFSRLDSVSRLTVDSMEAFAAKMEKLSTGEPNEFVAMSAITSGLVYSNRGKYELGKKKFEQALRLLKNSKKDTLKARAYTGIGNYYKNTGDSPKAFKYLHSALKIYEKAGQRRGISMAQSNIGQVYMQINDHDQAKVHLKRAMEVFENEKWRFPYMSAAHTLANIYGMNGEYQEALKIDSEAIRISDSLKSDKWKVPFLDNKAMCYMYSGKLDSAEYFFGQTLKIDFAIGDEKQIADSYSNLARLEMMKHNFAKAEEYALKSIEILNRVKNSINLSKAYDVLAEIYSAWGKPAKAYEARNQYLSVYKQLMNERKEEAAAEFKVVYETEKKEKIIAQSRLELLEKEKEVRERNNLLIFLSIVAVSIGLIGFLIYRQQRLKNRQLAQEHELKTAIAQIETQNKLQQQRLEISRDLHDNIGAQLTFVISSVDNLRYAFDLKDSKLERKLDSISNFTKATIVELRDTIWAMNHSEISLEDLRVRIFNFIEQAKGAKESIGFGFHIAEELQALKLSSVCGMNLYRTVQEAVNNALKHSQASRIGIFMECDGEKFQLRIEDNGKGFEVSSSEKGNGLSNMKKRVEALGGDFRLESSVGSGTHICISIPGICERK